MDLTSFMVEGKQDSFAKTVVGDKLLYYSGRLASPRVVTCVRTSEASLWCDVGEGRILRFHRACGSLVGRNSYSHSCVMPYTEEQGRRIREIEERKEIESYFKRFFEQRPWKSWGVEKMRQVKKMLEQTGEK